MFLVSAPSGTGKTTLSKLILENDEHISLSISCTTRKKRSQEVDEKDYYFMNKEEFLEKEKRGGFLEYAEIFGNFYGTPKKRVLDKLSVGEDVLFDIDWQGNRQLSAIARPDVTSVFLLPPSIDELHRRLQMRNEDSKEVIEERMARAEEEISHWHEYDYVIINRDIEQSLSKLLMILKSERLRKGRRVGINNFVSTLITKDLIKNRIV